MGWKENEDRLGRHTKTSRRQTKRTAHYKTWARWVPTTRKTGRLRQTSRHVTSRHVTSRDDSSWQLIHQPATKPAEELDSKSEVNTQRARTGDRQRAER